MSSRKEEKQQGERRPRKGGDKKSADSSSQLAPDAIPALRNFLIGLIVCAITIVVAVAAILNADQLKQSFVSASQGVHKIVPKEERKPAPNPISLDPPPPPKNELYGDEPDNVRRSRDPDAAPDPPPAKRQKMRIQ